MDTKKIIKIYSDVFFEIKNLWSLSDSGKKSHYLLDNFLDELNLKKNPENRLIAYFRISELKTDPLSLYLDNIIPHINENNDKLNLKIPNKLDNKVLILEKSYNYVKKIYENLFSEFIVKLKQENLIDEFELSVFEGILSVGKAFNTFFVSRQKHINNQNKILDEKFGFDSIKIMKFLDEKNLLDTDEEGNITDRSYSVLKGGKSVSYYEAFPLEVSSIISCLNEFVHNLDSLDDSRKSFYITYLESIKEAFSEKNTKKLFSKWQKVDESWMNMKDPMQIGHPLEFYEDKYRKAVAPEWDLRITDDETLKSNAEIDIENMYEKLYDEIGRDKFNESYVFSKDNFSRVGLYVSQPVLYFGSELNGLFSAQVVPNDELVSEKFGKKIFAFPKMVLSSKKKAPLMKIISKVLDSKLINDYLNILENDEIFYEIYDIETIGHEFGHTLWLTKNTEVLMNNKTGNFKNIEEFKATAGGLVAYFMSNKTRDDYFNKNILIMHLFRCIGLLKYRKVPEVLPYYNESLIHLDIMFNSGIFNIKDGKINLLFNENNFSLLKQNYIKSYKNLIYNYLEKRDAGEFLYNYVVKNSSGDNIGKNKVLGDFQNYYYDLYLEIGNELNS